jgi:CelD/BcsL family acetyltransferase involved in cellulose biosynthesis
MGQAADQINVTLIPITVGDLLAIETDWRALEVNAQCHYFLTWDWLGAWVKQSRGNCYLLKATVAERVVGLSFIFANTRRVFKCYGISQWWLNRTGIEQYDQAWLEYNDFLIEQTVYAEVKQAMLSFIATDNSWDEFIIGMTDTKTEQAFNVLSRHKRMLIEDIGYDLKLSTIANNHLSDIVSRNTRQKINQTKKLLKQYGQVNFSVLTTTEEKLNALPSLKTFHINKWSSTPTPSGFNFVPFSNSFLQQIQANTADIIQLSLNAQPIGFLVCYRFKDRVYFYLSALTDQYSGKIKLGLYMHNFAIDYYQAKGLDYYDFLNGRGQYKQSLTNNSYQQNMCCYAKSNVVLLCEYRLRTLKSSLTNHLL